MNTSIETTNEAQAYADSIAAGLKAWTVAADFIADAAEEDNGELLTLASYVAEYYPDFTDIAGAEELATDQLATIDSIGEAWDIYLADALCVELTGKHGGTGWTVTGAEITVTYGGPSCWIEWNGSDRLTVRAAWGQDKGYTSVHCSGLADALASYVENVNI